MLGQVGWGEMLLLLVVGLFVFGPERLPKVAQDAARMLRELRKMANGVREEIRTELGDDFADLDIQSLHPKTFVAKHLFGDGDETVPGQSRRPADMFANVPTRTLSLDKAVAVGADGPAAGGPPPYDSDAT